MSAGPGRDSAKERHWRAMVADQRRSGLTIVAFCQQRQLASSAFHFWKRELRSRDAERQAARPAARFLPVTVADALPAQHSASPLELVLPSGETLRVPAGFDPATLAQVLGLLRGAPAC
jgi:transposase